MELLAIWNFSSMKNDLIQRRCLPKATLPASTSTATPASRCPGCTRNGPLRPSRCRTPASLSCRTRRSRQPWRSRRWRWSAIAASTSTKSISCRTGKTRTGSFPSMCCFNSPGSDKSSFKTYVCKIVVQPRALFIYWSLLHMPLVQQEKI